MANRDTSFIDSTRVPGNTAKNAATEAQAAAPEAIPFKGVKFSGKTGAGEGIRTLDPNLGKVVLYP